MQATIVRIFESLQGAMGLLYFSDLEFYCFTLQPDSQDALKFYIPDGHYIARRVGGESWRKWPNTFEIVRPGTNGIDGHSALLFHSGNVEKHSAGCILLGDSMSKLQGERAVLNSGATFTRFLHHTKDVNTFNLDIRTVR
jgi:hypothetical protein